MRLSACRPRPGRGHPPPPGHRQPTRVGRPRTAAPPAPPRAPAVARGVAARVRRPPARIASSPRAVAAPAARRRSSVGRPPSPAAAPANVLLEEGERDYIRGQEYKYRMHKLSRSENMDADMGFHCSDPRVHDTETFQKSNNLRC
ncbi:uncharacterized protein A4U43_C04F10580 [Asparagus officinalis]|uniref:Uncharacterized protein n=1 Tax=Asparagus officinalis TaxID=4686 RepID=A0A5P1F0B8_ASPOF|nr:uncharacterized protein A4U43_C04F10580 [Asparagus officinalis]